MIGNKIKLSGFNNLTKILSFNFYDFCIAVNEKEKIDYVEFIHKKYSASKINETIRKICKIIDAKILSESVQDYDPVGASALTLMSDIKGGQFNWAPQSGSSKNSIASPQINAHLDKSHISAHTYPDAEDPHGICTFRVDIDVATCGEIIPLDAINFLFESFECDVVYIDYVVRGYTRLENGKKIYNDHHFNSIQDFIHPDILAKYLHRSDINMAQDNIWQTKLLVNTPSNNIADYFLGNIDQYSKEVIENKMGLLQEEMRQVFHLIH